MAESWKGSIFFQTTNEMQKVIQVRKLRFKRKHVSASQIPPLSQVNLYILVMTTGNSVKAELGLWRQGECTMVCIK